MKDHSTGKKSIDFLKVMEEFLQLILHHPNSIEIFFCSPQRTRNLTKGLEEPIPKPKKKKEKQNALANHKACLNHAKYVQEHLKPITD